MALKWFDNVAELLARGVANAGMNAFEVYRGPFAYVKDAMSGTGPGPRQDVELVNARIFKVTLGSEDYDSVVLCKIDAAGAPSWTIYCSDQQVRGEQRNDGKTLAAALRKDGKVGSKLCNLCEASSWVSKITTTSTCGFFKMMAKKDKFCGHTEAVMASMTKDDLDLMVTELKDWQSGADVSATAAAGPMSAEEAVFYDAAFVQNVLLAGERGSGKTYLARQAADRYDAVYLEMQMHPSMEPWEFRAHDRALNGKVYTVLGKLAEAVHWIKQGKKVVLCMDEFLNMNPVYSTTINTPLTLTANDTYLIETGVLIEDPANPGIATSEIVEVPSDMLWVVATSNIGARYGLDKITPSVRARFLIILMNTDPDRTKKILEKNLSDYGMPLELAEMFESFISACNQAVGENTLDEEATTRLACNVIRSVHKKAKRDKKTYPTLKSWLPVVKAQLMQEAAQVVSFELGPLDEDQAALYKTLVDTCIKVK